MSLPAGPLTVEQGRALQARAQRYKVVERVAIAVSGLAIPLFGVSYFELRRLDDAVAAGGSMGVPYVAYTAILMFVVGTIALFVMRHLIADISRVLAAEQRRRWIEGDAPLGGEAASAIAGTSQDETTPAAAG